MENSVFRISLDVHRQTTQAHLAVKKGDTARTIIASLSDGGKPYKIEDGCSATFMAQKPDGNVLYNACRIENNRIVYDFTEQTVSAAGRMPCELRLYGADDKVITSPKIAIIVSGTVYEDDEVESTSEFTALSQAMADVAELKKTGLKGDPGDNVELRYADHQVVWRYVMPEGEPEDEWKVLFSSDDVRDQVVQETLDEAKSAAASASQSSAQAADAASRAEECVQQAQKFEQDAYNEAENARMYAEQAAAAVANRMRIGVPLTIKDPKLNFDTTAKTITWGVNFFAEYNNANHVITASTISYADVGNIVYFCVNLQSEAVELTSPAGYDPVNQVVVFVFVVAGLQRWGHACTLPFPYMVNGEYVRVVDALPNPNKLTITGAVEAEYDGSEPVSVDIPQEKCSITLSPGDNIQAAVDAGYTTIVLNAGNYPASPVTVQDKNSIRFVVPDAGYDSRKMKKNAVIDNSINMDVSTNGELLTANFAADTESNWYKVFVTQELPPVRTGLRSVTYNAILWETDTADNGNDAKLVPVLTMEECEATAGSFYYAHGEGLVYIHPLAPRETNVYKRLQVEEGALFSVVNVNRVYMENIEVKYAPQYLNLNTISDLTAVSCIVSHTAYEGGFKVNGVNGVFRDCEAYKVCADGFGIGGNLNGYTEYFNCHGHHCYDDGISHHNGSAGAIYGGVWHHNGKAGVAPAHGSVVNVYNAVAHSNSTGFYSKSDATIPEAMGREAHYFNCIAYNNNYGIGVKNYHVTAYNCQFKDNAWEDTIVDSDSEESATSLTIV